MIKRVFFNIKKLSIGAVAFILILVVILQRLNYKPNNKNLDFDIDISSNLDVFEGLYKQIDENKVVIGKTKNEVDNGYYDILIKEEKNELNVKVVNLKINSIDNIYSEEYINNLFNYINKLLNENFNEDVFKENIIKYYTELRKNVNYEILEKKEYIDSNYCISFEVDNYILILKIRRIK